MKWLGRSPGDRRAPEPGSYEQSGAWTVDRAIRALTTGCAAHQRPVPAVGAVVLGPETVALRLTTPDENPAPGWTVEEHGRTWRASLRWLQTAAVDDRLPEPFPLLVSLGMTDDGRLLLNLAEAAGMISLEGDTELARGLARSWARRLATSPWAAAIRVIRVGFEPDPDFTGLDVARLIEVAATLDGPEPGAVLLFAGQPLGRDLHQVDRLLGEPARRWSVVAVDAAEATWRFVVGVDGTVDTGLLDEHVRLRP
ncbi:hypothetical protein [Melissospora conviva]|uniref:hypothetical protein n=1 Tax=Melissospora conviva TaxID=3388432 RepID=UPI003C155E71